MLSREYIPAMEVKARFGKAATTPEEWRIYTYNWSNAQTSATVGNVAAGSYLRLPLQMALTSARQRPQKH